ncbi:MAG: pyridoxine 5'-phosphate synthase [Pseudomonadota bacterium]
MVNMKLRLGINIDHVATLRNARGGNNPCPIRAALLALEAGADGITAHLREDRRHIRDSDIERLKNEVKLPLNLEMAATQEMLDIALKVKPHAVCLVPEKREELTTEGGLDVVMLEKTLSPYIKKLQDNGSRVSLFIAANSTQIEAAKRTGAKVVELHTGTYAEEPSQANLEAIINAAKHAHNLGLEVHAGHGLNYDNITNIAAIPEIVELNIGHFLIGEAVFVGLKYAIIQMRNIMNKARGNI